MARPRTDKSDRYDPCQDITWKFIDEKGFKDRYEKLWELRRVLKKHLKAVADGYVKYKDGVILPESLGIIQTIGLEAYSAPKDRSRTKKSFAEGDNKVIRHTNFHSDGIVYRVVYRTYRNNTKKSFLSNYPFSFLWTFKAARLTKRKKLSPHIRNNRHYYHVFNDYLI